MRKVAAVCAVILAGVSAAIGFAPPTYADTTHPDSVSIDSVYVQRNLLENGDVLFIAYYNIAYTVPPTDPIDETFIFRLLTTNGQTELGQVLAYPYVTLGYGEGVVSWYFDASDAPAWDTNYRLRISENPAKFDEPTAYNFQVKQEDFTSSTTTAANQDELEQHILDFAEDLEVAWNTTLTESQDPGIVLNSSGEIYFRNAIYGLQDMAPDVFFYQTLSINYTARSWNTTQASTYRTRFDGTWVGDAIDGLANLVRVDRQLLTGGFVVMLSVLAMWLSWRKLGSTHPGLLACLVITLGAAALGWIGMVFLAIIGLFLVMYIGYFVFYSKA